MLDRIAAYSTDGFMDRPLNAALEAIANAGFTQVEIDVQKPHFIEMPDKAAAREIRLQLKTLGIHKSTVHAPAGRHVLGAPEEAWRHRNVSIFTDILRFSASIESSALVIHPVPNPIFVTDTPDIAQRIREAVIRSLDELLPLAEQEHIRILLENLPYKCPYPFLDMGELRPLVELYSHKELALLVDTGHAWTRGLDPAEEIRIAGSLLHGVHLQDVDGKKPDDNHWIPTHGDLNWDAIRKTLMQINYMDPWTFEVICPRYGETPEAMAALCYTIATNWGIT